MGKVDEDQSNGSELEALRSDHLRGRIISFKNVRGIGKLEDVWGAFKLIQIEVLFLKDFLKLLIILC